MKWNVKKNSIVVVLILMSFLFSSQALALVSGQQVWLKHYGGDYLNGRPTAMVKDNKDNLYIVGTIGNGIVLVKYDSAGNQRWARKYPGLQLNDNSSLVVDSEGSAYVAGSRYNGNDGEEIALLKYSAVGNLMWLRKFGSHSRYAWGSQTSGLVIDKKDKIYVAGSNRENFILMKYDKLGNRLWTRQYDDKKGTYSFAGKLVIDKDNNLLISGVNITFARYYRYEKINFSIIKYSSTGTRKWITNLDKSDYGFYFGEGLPQLVTDTFGNVIVATSEKGPKGSSDYKITKLNSDGKQKWTRWYDAGADSLSAVTVDGAGNIYATGQTVTRFGKIIDQDFSTVKYDKKGNRRWARRFDGSGTNDNSFSNNDMDYYPSYDGFYSYGQLKDKAVGIVIGNNNSVYVTGVINAGKKRNSDFMTVKYDSRGKQRWARTYNSTYKAIDSPTAILRDMAGNIYVAGNSVKSRSSKYSRFSYWYYYPYMSDGRFTILKYTP